MSRAAMAHLLILKRSYKEGRGHPYYTSRDVPTRVSCRVFKSLYTGKMDMIDAHLAHNPITGIFDLEVLAKLAKLFSDVLQ